MGLKDTPKQQADFEDDDDRAFAEVLFNSPDRFHAIHLEILEIRLRKSVCGRNGTFEIDCYQIHRKKSKED